MVNGGSVELTLERLPLAVYREVAAHLQLLEPLEVSLTPQTSTEFDYLQSQVGGIRLQSAASSDGQHQVVGDRLVEILEHYAQRFGPWVIA